MSEPLVTIRYLEMRAPPKRRIVGFRPPGYSLVEMGPCPVTLYRRLYEQVGAASGWLERRLLSDAQLAETLARPTSEISVLYFGETPVGFFELDTTAPHETEFRHVGVIPEFIGRGAGPYLLQAAVDRAWSRPIERVYGWTSSLDHPSALRLYRLMGITVYAERAAPVP